MGYVKTSKVIDDETDATADQYNSLMAEVKAAVEGLSTHDVDMAFTHAGGSGGDLVDTVTVTDNSADAGFRISGLGTWSYDGDDYITQFQYVFDAAEMNMTVTEVYTYDGNNNITGIARTLS
jgi:hypothetical protein